MKIMYVIILFILTFLLGCNNTETGTCNITCRSASSGAIYSNESFPNYTEEECEEQFKGTTTSLVPCTKEWIAD